MPPPRKPRSTPLKAALPPALEPQLATLASKPPAGDWLYEVKFDGYRMLARVEGDNPRLITRNGNDWTSRFPALVSELVASKLPPGWYDGEIVLLDERGQPNFNALQNAIEGGGNKDIVFYLFDVCFMAGEDLRPLPVEERRARLAAALQETERLRFSQELPGQGRDLLASACKMGLEGLIAKRRGSPYVHRRSGDWVKLKCAARQEFVIGGYTWPESAGGGIGALLVGYFDDAGKLHYAGKVGTGFTGEMLTRLRSLLDAIKQPERPFEEGTGHDRRATWARPQVVCEVEYREWPAAGSLRHPAFKGLREDKKASTIRREQQPLAAPEAHAARKAAIARKAPGAAEDKLQVTHGARVIDPSTGLTKLDLVRYYAQVAPWALPHLKGRPAYIKRAPEGVAGEMFFQQHPEGMPGLTGTDPALWPGHEPAIAFDTAADLAAAAQLGMVELHTWNSTSKAILLPDRVIFDLDPGDGVTWPQIQQAATLVHTMLEALGLQCWLKTTGGKGLHVVVPLKPELDYNTVKAFSKSVVDHMAKTIPQLFVAKSGPRNRVGRIFIDYLRNGQSQSTAAAFSARARPGLGVSMPVAWDELPALTGGAHWNITTGLERLAALKENPWQGYWKCRQSLRSAADRFGF